MADIRRNSNDPPDVVIIEDRPLFANKQNTLWQNLCFYDEKIYKINVYFNYFFLTPLNIPNPIIIYPIIMIPRNCGDIN